MLVRCSWSELLQYFQIAELSARKFIVDWIRLDRNNVLHMRNPGYRPIGRPADTELEI